MTRLRRDPRAERAAARTGGAERPRFDLAIRASVSRRPRRDPRAEAASQRVLGFARLRLDRSQFGAAPLALSHQPERPAEKAPPKTVIVESPEFFVLVVPDVAGGRLGEHDRQLFGAGRELAGKTGATLALVGAETATLGPAGADRVAILSPAGGYDPAARAADVAATIRALDPRHVLFAESPEGGDLARRVAVLTGEALFTDAEQVSASTLGRPARNRKVEQRSAPTRLITLAPDSVPAYAGAPREARVEPVDLTSSGAAGASGAIVSATVIPADPATVPLALADFVTSAGNGVTDLEMFKAVVAALGATPGASRVLCDAGLMPRDRQVGASGTVLGATCYFALGIAGAPQHLQGVADCEHIVAVNTDLHAAMVARAGLGIIQDAQLVMPAILEELERERGRFETQPLTLSPSPLWGGARGGGGSEQSAEGEAALRRALLVHSAPPPPLPPPHKGEGNAAALSPDCPEPEERA